MVSLRHEIINTTEERQEYILPKHRTNKVRKYVFIILKV